jgi:hypothetical protein
MKMPERSGPSATSLAINPSTMLRCNAVADHRPEIGRLVQLIVHDHAAVQALGRARNVVESPFYTKTSVPFKQKPARPNPDLPRQRSRWETYRHASTLLPLPHRHTTLWEPSPRPRHVGHARIRDERRSFSYMNGRMVPLARMTRMELRSSPGRRSLLQTYL